MSRAIYVRIFSLLLVMLLAACNLSGGGESAAITLTADSALTLLPSRTPLTTSNAPTPLPLGSLIATQQTVLPRPTNAPFIPTALVIIPTFSQPIFLPTNTSTPISILILSPVPGNVVAGNVQILGAAVHPQFLQYQLEYGPESTPNLWYQATSAVQTPITNGILGVWNTSAVPDGTYNLRLRVYLRDGATVATVINNVRVQNRTATPVPSATPNIPRPIAAFTQDAATGQVPLTVRFINQSTGDITNTTWNFGDGSSSGERDPVKTFNAPGLFNVTLTIAGPGGTSNVSRQINVQSPTAPVSSFSATPLNGNAPLNVQFTDQSTGTINSRLWNFSDGGASNERNPVHVFNAPGVYNVFLTVTGTGGSSTSTR
ncbi:MAG: PKD domain-containing protein, partial [Chloroflexota bacterium]|nr:PKD domain-containing protein [Chloroflexota bacterium]